jgi:hypothetical protein
MPAIQVREAVVRYLRRKSDEVRRFIATDTGAVGLCGRMAWAPGCESGKASRLLSRSGACRGRGVSQAV